MFASSLHRVYTLSHEQDFLFPLKCQVLHAVGSGGRAMEGSTNSDVKAFSTIHACCRFGAFHADGVLAKYFYLAQNDSSFLDSPSDRSKAQEPLRRTERQRIREVIWPSDETEPYQEDAFAFWGKK